MKSFQAVAIQYLEYQRPIIKQSSYETYHQWIWNHLIPYFGNMECIMIKKQNIQRFILDKASHGRLDFKGGLSEKTIKGMVTVLRTILEFARDFYSLNPDVSCFSKLSYPKVAHKKQPHIFSIQEQTAIQNYIVDHLSFQSLGILFALQTGIRIGELCALQRGDIDFRKKIVHITKTLQRIPHTATNRQSSSIIISTPKSNSSIRIIPLAPGLFCTLTRLVYPSSNCYIITGTEQYTEPRGYYNYYQRILREAGVTYTNFHTTRHTFATRCIESGADCKTVSEILGHSSVKTTLDLYMHPQIDQKRLCIEKMTRLL